MLRRFADSVYDFLHSLYPPRESDPRDSASFGRIPSPIREYLERALDARLDVESARLRHHSSEWFDVDHEDVALAFESLSSALKEHGHFPPDEWSAALERGVRNVISYHSRPGRTLVEFLFAREEETYTLAEFKQKLEFFQPYPYLVEASETYVDEHQLEELDQDAVASIVEQIDRKMAERFDVDAWTRLLNPLFEIARILPEYEKAIPIELFITFFRDKGVSAIERRLERMHEEDGVDLMSRDELRDILESVRNPVRQPQPGVRVERVVHPEFVAPQRVAPGETDNSGPSAPIAPSVQQPSAPPAEEPLRPRVPDHVPAHVEAAAREANAVPSNQPDGPVPLWKQFQSPAKQTNPAPVAPRPAPPVQASRDEGEARPLWMRFSENRDDAPRESRPNLNTAPPGVTVNNAPAFPALERHVLGEEGLQHRRLFVRELFSGSEEEYRETLTRLSRAETWAAASRIIANDVFRVHEVNIYSEPAVLFTNAVESRFQS